MNKSKTKAITLLVLGIAIVIGGFIIGSALAIEVVGPPF